MEELFPQFLEHLSSNIWLQGLLIAAGSCFIEDPARCVVAVLVADGKVDWRVAFSSMIIGGMAGDFGLYLIGRYASIFVYKHRWISFSKVAWMKNYFKHHAIKTLFAARFLPGGRLPTYTVAGIIRFAIPKLLIILFCAAFAQALIFLKLGDLIEATLLPYLTSPWLKYGVLGFTLLTFYISYKMFGKKRKKKLASQEAEFQKTISAEEKGDDQ